MGWKAAQKLIHHWKILRGDNVRKLRLNALPFIFYLLLHWLTAHFFIRHRWQVMIIRGKDKGETGIVKRVIRTQNRVIVEGKNLVSYLVYVLK